LGKKVQLVEINPLAKETFNINKNLSNENSYTWYTFATEIFKEVELNKNNFEDFNQPFLFVDNLSQLLETKFPSLFISRLVFFANSPPKHDISV
jgi:dTDP-4-dehydrorhamnose reductase